MLAYFPSLAAFLVAVVVVLWSTPRIKRLALRRGFVDKPNSRKVHQAPMVRLGGVAMFLGFILALIVAFSLGGFQGLPWEKQAEIYGVILGASAYFAVGLLDDILNLSPSSRLLMQIFVAIGAWSAGVQINFLTIPGMGLTKLPDIISIVITVIWLVGITNAINWIDGLDGLAAGVAGIAASVMFATCLAMNQPGAAIVAAALAGSSIGFLRYNFNPAQIFMGDGGAYFTGFTLAGVGVIGLVKGVTTVAVFLPSIVVILPYLILAVPILDMSAVIVDRLWRGKSPFIADKRHLHHRLLNAGVSHRHTVLFIYSLTLWVGSFAYGCFTFASSKMPAGFIYCIGATGLVMFSSWQVWRIARQSEA
jgi:UDP-GlcNAc:undecaprenyl-phosphate/decaprenyl-phosphate GlcNAc-1-phosphate transferase